RVDEDVRLGRDARVAVERPHRHEGDVPVGIEARQLRAAAPAEDVRVVAGFGDLVGVDQVLAAGDAHAVDGGEEVRRVCRAPCLAAALAVTVLDAQRLALDDEGDAAAEAASLRLAGVGSTRGGVREARDRYTRARRRPGGRG